MPVYLLLYTALFWVPAFCIILALWKKLDSPTKKAFWMTFVAMACVSVLMEYLYLKFDVWYFSEAIDPLLGIWIWKAPIEEYVFWFGATPFCLSLYFAYSRIWGKNNA